MKSFYADRYFIERKYHNPDEPFNPYARMAYHGYDFDASTGLEDGEIREGLEALTAKNAELPHPVQKAFAVKYVLDNTKIDVNEHDFFVGFWSVGRLIKPYTWDKWWRELCEGKMQETAKLIEDLSTSGAVSIWADFDHVIPDWDSILTLGFKGLRERAARFRRKHEEQGTLTPEAAAHFDGIDIMYGAIEDIVGRFYELALKQTYPRAKAYADCLLHIKDGAPTNIYEAMQVIYIYFMISECFDSYQVRSLGNGLDNTLYSFYKRDIEEGRYTREEIKELLAYFLMQWSAIGNYWGQPFYMGGTNADGSTRYNELSRDILDIYNETGIFNPKIQMKINTNMPDDILYKVLDMIRRGHNCFALCCEPGYMKALMNYGASYEEALSFDIRGCYETGMRSNEVSSSVGYVNALRALLYVFSNGYDCVINKQIGIKTGEIDEFRTFDDFYNALLKQWDNLIELTIKAGNDFERYLSYVNPSLMYSATIEGSLEKGVDAYQCGVKYNNSHILSCGLASLTDAVMAVKELVYDSHVVSLAELKRALDNNWEDYEELRVRALSLKHKYGNDDAEADAMAVRLSQHFLERCANRPNARGGVYKLTTHPAMQFVWQGQKTGATPDGRRAGDEFSKNSSPSVGMDKNGITALVNSALKLKPYLYNESFCVDLMLHTSTVGGDSGLSIMKAVVMTYLKGDGMALQMNVFNTETLRDAQIHPEKYENLQVRICGWNALWNTVPKPQQDAYIKRCEGLTSFAHQP